MPTWPDPALNSVQVSPSEQVSQLEAQTVQAPLLRKYPEKQVEQFVAEEHWAHPLLHKTHCPSTLLKPSAHCVH